MSQGGDDGDSGRSEPGGVLPDFVIIGAMKAGTSSLYHHLRTHPEIFMPAQKELNFFNRDWHLGHRWYEAHFEEADPVQMVGEASPNYTKAHFWPETAERLASLAPEARLIYLLREPVERMRSNYLHQLAAGKENRPIERALREEEDLRTQDYIHTSRYGFQLERYMDHFDRRQILVASSDRLLHHTRDTVRDVFRFLGVDEDWIPPNIHRQKHQTARKRVRRTVARSLRTLPGYRAAAGLVPLPIKRQVFRYATRPIEVPKVSPDLRTHLKERLRPDLERLRSLIDLPEVESWAQT